MSTPGRTCPRHYRTRPSGFAGPAQLSAETIYVVGGLYGNEAALEKVRALARREVEAGYPRPVLVFNGDFNWFNATPETFRGINEAVLEHVALQGNVEAELSNPTPGAGCGCAYPNWVADGMVERSNEIMERLQNLAGCAAAVSEALAALPRQLTVRVGPMRVGILHGDPTSIAGWGLAVESVPPPGATSDSIAKWFRAADVRGFACAHTCLPYVQDFEVDGDRCLVANNGAAGMPNFRGDDRGILTRIRTSPAPVGRLYGTQVEDVYWEAIGVPCTPPSWIRWFKDTWPPDSPAWLSYHERLVDGPAYERADAVRLDCRSSALTDPSC